MAAASNNTMIVDTPAEVLDARPGSRLGHRRVRDAPGEHRRPQAARRLEGPPGSVPHERWFDQRPCSLSTTSMSARTGTCLRPFLHARVPRKRQ